MQSDPIGLEGGLNTYGYVMGNPLIFLDTFGLDEASLSPVGYGGTVAFGWGTGRSFGGDISVCASLSPTGIKASIQITKFDNIYGVFVGHGTQAGLGYGDEVSKGWNNSTSDSEYLGSQVAYRAGGGISFNQNESGVSASGGGGRVVKDGVGAYAGSGKTKTIDVSYGW